MSEDLTYYLDANGDGVIDSEDMKIWWKKISTVVGYNLPAGYGDVLTPHHTHTHNHTATSSLVPVHCDLHCTAALMPLPIH